MYIFTCIRNKNCHQHSYGFQNLMSSWGWGNTIFKITLCTWFFKYLVPKVIFFLFFPLYSSVFSRILKTFFAVHNLKKFGSKLVTFFFCFLLNSDVNWGWDIQNFVVLEPFPTNSLPLPPGSRYDLRDEREARVNINCFLVLLSTTPSTHDTLPFLKSLVRFSAFGSFFPPHHLTHNYATTL